MRVVPVFVLAALIGAACQDRSTTGPSALGSLQGGIEQQAAPGPLVTIPVGGGSARIWPYLTDDLVTAQDPVNLIFAGQADPRAIRDALLALNGNRTPVFPAVFPFTCTWSDAIGGLMAGYGETALWGGAAVQLQCGTYGPIRFHLRLVKLGDFTLGNVHFEVVIPGTTDHQVLSWELAEQLATYDLARTGLLGAAPGDAGALNAAPSHRSIPPVIYNALPADLQALIGGPAGPVASPVGIANNGHATTFVLAGRAAAATPTASQRLTLEFNQIIPKPFCANGPGGFLLVQGPIVLEQDVTTRPGGALRKIFRAEGELTAVPFDLQTFQPVGLPFRAKVSEQQESQADDAGGRVHGQQHQQLIGPAGADPGQLLILFDVGPGNTPRFDRKVTCQ